MWLDLENGPGSSRVNWLGVRSYLAHKMASGLGDWVMGWPIFFHMLKKNNNNNSWSKIKVK